MASTERTETYWRDNRLYPVTNVRPSGRGPWPRIQRFPETELVAILEGGEGNFNIKEGAMATPDRVNQSIVFHRGIPLDSWTLDAWKNAPQTAANIITDQIKKAEERVCRQWEMYSNEEAMTGALFGQMEGEYRIGRWKFVLKFVEFSKQTKEPITGTDIAVVLDIQTARGLRGFKTIWLQAKRSRTVPDNPLTLPRLQTQNDLAGKFTKAHYPVIYTPNGVFVTGTPIGDAPLHRTIFEAIQCRIGDPSINALKNSLNRQRIFDISLMQID